MNLYNSKDSAVLDIETDGLSPTKIWCCVVSVGCGSTDTRTKTCYEPYQLRDFLNCSAGNYNQIVAHNGIAFDFPIIKELWDISLEDFKVPLVDTLVLSRLADPSRQGGHSLKRWGERLNFPKGDHSDWSKLTDEMIHYCQQDVAVTLRVLDTLQEELRSFSPESIKLEHDVQKSISKQIKRGWLLDQKYAFSLLSQLKESKYDIEEKVQSTFVPLPTFVKEVIPKVKKDGNLSSVGLKFLGEQQKVVGGSFSRIDFPEFNLGSRQQIGDRLKKFGWNPKKFTEHGQAIVDEAVLSSVEGIPEASLIAEYLMLQKRTAQVQSWLAAVKEDGRVHGYVNSNGAVTGRMTHSSPNMAQVPSIHSPYGEECRTCWSCPEEYSIVGIDASGLELRMLAHYMNDKEYTNEVINGDIHTTNQKLAGLESRNQAKTFIYALIYGAGNGKLGEVVGGSGRHGERLRQSFFDNLPALKNLTEAVSKKASGVGHLRGLDGRVLYVRSQHSALNTLLQGAGAIIMKRALTLLDEYAILWGIDFNLIGNIHDEIQCEVIKGKEDVFGRLAVDCIKAAGIEFKLNCPLDGEYKVGKTWAQTH